MTLHYQHRRISARAKRRYRSIRDFLRRALGSSSHQKFNINSSIAVNVTDLKHRLTSEKNYNRDCGKSSDGVINKTIDKQDSVLSVPVVERRQTEAITDQKENSLQINKTECVAEACACQQNQFSTIEHKILLNHRHKKTKMHKNRNTIQKNPKNLKTNESDIKIVKNNYKLNQYKTPCLYKNTAYYSTSCQSLSSFNIQNINIEYLNYKNQQKYCKPWKNQEPCISPKDKTYNHNTKRYQPLSPNRSLKERSTAIKKNLQKNNVDQDFITDIINRQYKPIKLFGRRESQISQFSVPVCRDVEFCYRDKILEGTDICSCCHTFKHKKNNALNRVNSVCDYRLYDLTKQTNPKVYNRKYDLDIYNNADEYDLIPVKESSNIKVRKKSIEYNDITHQYREVLPSPRSQRPRLNLKAQYYTEINDYMVQVEHPKIKRPLKIRTVPICKESAPDSSELFVSNKKYKEKDLKNDPIAVEKDAQIQENISKNNNEEYSNLVYDLSTLHHNKSPQTDKTEKALYEIKDLLQIFLKEIKKDPLPQRCNKSDATVKTVEQESDLMPPTKGKNSLTGSSKNYNIDQNVIPYMPPFSNCYYPILQVPCPMNLQSNYMIPCSSYTCQPCLTNPSNILCKETQCSKYKPTHTDIQGNINGIKSNETEEMIKEIYKCVTRNPNGTVDKDVDFQNSPSKYSKAFTKNTLTSRSVVDFLSRPHQDGKVDTKKVMLFSKSCEAINAQSVANTETDQEHVYYSDTMSGNLSLQLTDTRVDLSQSLITQTESTVTEQISPVSMKKEKDSKFSKLMKSFSLFKKKTTNQIDNKRTSKPENKLDLSFRKNTVNFSPHGQDNFQRSTEPSSPTYQYTSSRSYQYPSPGGYSRRSGFEHGITHSPLPKKATSQDFYNAHSVHQQTIPEYQSIPHYPPVHFESPYSSYNSSFNPNSPHIPLCLKEIEVKNTAVQSDCKLSFFKRISKKLKPQTPITTATDMSSEQQEESQQTDEGKKKWNWLGFAGKQLMNESPMAFSQKTRKELQEKDAMIKKLLRRKNPFTPRNLFLQALLGKNDPLKFNKHGLFSK